MGEVNRTRIAPSAVVWLVVGATYFLIPLIATLLFSLRDAQTGKCCSLSAYGDILHDPQFWSTIKISFRLALETIVVGLLLFVPTIYWVHLKVPRLRPVVGFMALVPFVIPPIILVVGLLKFFKDTLHAPFWFLGKPDLFLAGAYVILAFPYIYFSLDAGFRSIDVHTLTEASRGLGASWRTTLGRVILPNIRVAALSGAFLTLAIVMGEFTIASLSAFHTFPTYLQQINQSKAYPAAAATLMSFMITWAAMLSILADRAAWRTAHRARGDRPVTAAAHVELQGLWRSFGHVTALQGIDLALGEGEFVSLLGPSGCGKTTALRLVAGFDQPDAGSILVGGKDVTRVSPNRRDMGMVFQAYSLFPNMTAEQNVEYGLKIRKKPKAGRRTRVRRVARARRARRRGQALPAPALGRHAAACRARPGARDRAAVCCCSTSHSRRSMRRCASSCARRSAASSSSSGITTIYVTHDQEEALSISDRVAVMYGGKIEQIGSPAGDVRHPGDAVRGRIHRHDEPAHRDRRGRGDDRLRGVVVARRCCTWPTARRARALPGATGDGGDRARRRHRARRARLQAR